MASSEKRKKRSQKKEKQAKKTTQSTEKEVITASPSYLLKFLMFLWIGFGLLALAFWVYNTVYDKTIVQSAQPLFDKKSDDNAKKAFELLTHLHLFSGIAEYHGFGPEEQKKQCKAISEVVKNGLSLKPKELGIFRHRVSCWIPAFRKYKIESNVAVNDLDWIALEVLRKRAENAVHTGYIFSTYATIQTLLLLLLWLLYRKKGLHEKIR